MPNLDAEVLNEPKKQIVKDFNKEEVVQIIQNAIDKGIINLGDIGGSEVVANPTLEGTEPNLEGLEVDGEKYKIPEGTLVEANPTLDGTESPLTGLQVGATKYAVGGGSSKHCYQVQCNSPIFDFYFYTDEDNITTVSQMVDVISKAPYHASARGRFVNGQCYYMIQQSHTFSLCIYEGLIVSTPNTVKLKYRYVYLDLIDGVLTPTTQVGEQTISSSLIDIKKIY